MTDTSDEFGDFEGADAFDTAPPDPEQVAIRLHQLRMAVDALAGARDVPTWDQLTLPERDLGRSIGGAMVLWLATHQPDAVEAARSLHNVRRYIATSPLPEWDQLNEDEQSVGIDLMTLIILWLRRQGGIQ